eukprot:m.284629 g.284629  ORF g.284629 m.284629 type:complete len:139 (+) comp11184_c0_seq1:41-457(+)
MSADLQWMIVRKHHAFLKVNPAGDRRVFSTEPGNLSNKHSFRSNGLVNKRTVDVSANKEGGVVLTTKKTIGARPKAQVSKTTLKRGARRTMKAIRGATKGYRADLTQEALIRASQILRSQKTKAPKVRRGRATKAKSA